MANFTFEKLQALFLNKYPNGVIWRTNKDNRSKYCITASITKTGKADTYNGKNYIEAVNKLKLDVKLIYERDYKETIARIAELSETLKNGIVETFFIEDTSAKLLTQEERNNIIFEIEYLENKIKNVVVI